MMTRTWAQNIKQLVHAKAAFAPGRRSITRMLAGFEEEEVGDDDEEDSAAEPDELENWTKKVVDWWDFATGGEWRQRLR